MAFGSGMIDVITISKLAATVYAVYKDAPVDYKPVAEEVNLLWGIISGAAKHFESTTLSGTTLSDNDRQEGQKVLKCCQNVLEDLNSLIEKYNSFAFTNTNQGFYRVELRTHDISALRARLASTTTLLCSFIQRCEYLETHTQLTDIQPQHVAVNGKRGNSQSPVSRSRVRQVWLRVRPPMDFVIGPLVLAAAAAGNTKCLISALECLRNINFEDKLKETALHKAAGGGYKDIVELLLQKGAWIEAITRCGDTPLHLAVRNGHTGIVELLLRKGALTEAVNKDNKTPLHLAVRNVDTTIVELLLEKGAWIEAMAEYNNTPLHVAVQNGHPSVVEILLNRGASIEALNWYNYTPLHLATSNGDARMVGLLLEKGAWTGAMAEHNNTPLHLAVRNGHTSIVELLLSEGASIQAMNEDNETSLNLAIQDGHTSMVELLLEKGA